MTTPPPPPPEDPPPGPPSDLPPGGPPSGGTPPPGWTPPPPPGYSSNDEKTWVLVAHFGGAAGMFLLGAAGGWIAPLIALVAKGNESPTIRQHAVNALNFQLTWSIVGVIGYATLCIGIGFVIIPVAAVVGIIFGIIGGVKANEGQLYAYPVSVKMIK